MTHNGDGYQDKDRPGDGDGVPNVREGPDSDRDRRLLGGTVPLPDANRPCADPCLSPEGPLNPYRQSSHRRTQREPTE